MNPLNVGDRVTNDQGWTGHLKRIEDCKTVEGRGYYWVHWQERENHQEKAIARHPICGHLPSEIWRAE